MNLKKTILTFFLIPILAVAGNRVFAQNCDHWLKIVRTDPNLGGIFVISDNQGAEIQSIIIPNGTDAVTAARIIDNKISVHKVLFCFSRVGPYLRVNDINISNFKFVSVGSPAGFKLQEVTRPNFVSKVDTATITANRKKHHAMVSFDINPETEMYDGYIIEPIAYEPKVPAFGQPTEKTTNWWKYKLSFSNDSFGYPGGIYAECSINEYNVDHYITIKVGIKKLVLNE